MRKQTYTFGILFMLVLTCFIPITIAGIGVREITAITIFTTIYNVSKEEILVVSLLGFIIIDIITAFVGFLLSLTETVDKKSFLKLLKLS